MDARPSAIAVVCTAMALSSCSPALQDDSALKVDTALAVPVTRAVEKPGYIDCFGAPAQRPTRLSLDCIRDETRVENITWQSWETDSASGRGTLIAPFAEPQEVDVELQSPVGSTFTDLYVDGELAYP